MSASNPIRTLGLVLALMTLAGGPAHAKEIPFWGHLPACDSWTPRGVNTYCYTGSGICPQGTQKDCSKKSYFEHSGYPPNEFKAAGSSPRRCVCPFMKCHYGVCEFVGYDGKAELEPIMPLLKAMADTKATYGDKKVKGRDVLDLYAQARRGTSGIITPYKNTRWYKTSEGIKPVPKSDVGATIMGDVLQVASMAAFGLKSGGALVGAGLTALELAVRESSTGPAADPPDFAPYFDKAVSEIEDYTADQKIQGLVAKAKNAVSWLSSSYSDAFGSPGVLYGKDPNAVIAPLCDDRDGRTGQECAELHESGYIMQVRDAAGALEDFSSPTPAVEMAYPPPLPVRASAQWAYIAGVHLLLLKAVAVLKAWPKDCTTPRVVDPVASGATTAAYWTTADCSGKAAGELPKGTVLASVAPVAANSDCSTASYKGTAISLASADLGYAQTTTCTADYSDWTTERLMQTAYRTDGRQWITGVIEALKGTTKDQAGYIDHIDKLQQSVRTSIVLRLLDISDTRYTSSGTSVFGKACDAYLSVVNWRTVYGYYVVDASAKADTGFYTLAGTKKGSLTKKGGWCTALADDEEEQSPSFCPSLKCGTRGVALNLADVIAAAPSRSSEKDEGMRSRVLRDARSWLVKVAHRYREAWSYDAIIGPALGKCDLEKAPDSLACANLTNVRYQFMCMLQQFCGYVPKDERSNHYGCNWIASNADKIPKGTCQSCNGKECIPQGRLQGSALALSSVAASPVAVGLASDAHAGAGAPDVPGEFASDVGRPGQAAKSGQTPARGGGCSTGTSAPPSWLGLLLLVLIATRRRRLPGEFVRVGGDA